LNFNYDFRAADTHELAHKIDKYFVRSINQKNFASAVKNARKKLDSQYADYGMFRKYLYARSN